MAKTTTAVQAVKSAKADKAAKTKGKGKATPAKAVPTKTAPTKVKKAVTSATAKTATKHFEKSERKAELGKPHIRALQTLAASTLPMSDKQISEASNIRPKWITVYVHASCRLNRHLSLVEQGLAKVRMLPNNGAELRCYVITAAGRKALAKAEKV